MARVGAVIVLLAALSAVVGPWVVPFDPAEQQLALRLQGPSLAHWFGLDELGRDILTRVLYGARISLLVGIVVVGVSASGPCSRNTATRGLGGVACWAGAAEAAKKQPTTAAMQIL